MSARHIVVVGASLGGLRAVETLRRLGNDARITLIGDESELPYDRPPLSKDLLLGKVDAVGVRLTTHESLAALDIELRLGERAIRLDPVARRLTLDKGLVEYDDLVIATGSSARRLPQQRDLPGVYALRTLDDALELRQALGANPAVAVVGGGFIGAEVASAVRQLGLEVTIIDPLPVLMQRVLGDVVGARVTRFHGEAGVRLRLRAQVADLVGRQTVEGVRLANGILVAADLVMIAVGATPNTDWLLDSGLEVRDGIVCDEYLCAGPGVYAIGDVVRWHHPLYGASLRAEHWTYAVEHARAVAATLTGQPTRCASVPYVWSDQHGVKLQIAGRVQPRDEVRFVMDEPRRFLALTGSDSVQHAAVAMSAAGAFVRQQVRLAGQPPWPPP